MGEKFDITPNSMQYFHHLQRLSPRRPYLQRCGGHGAALCQPRGFKPASDHWSVNAHGHNVSGYAVKQSVLPITTLGDRRPYGVTLGLKW